MGSQTGADAAVGVGIVDGRGPAWFVGHVASFAQSSLGLVLLVVVPGALLVVSELYNLYVAATED